MPMKAAVIKRVYAIDSSQMARVCASRTGPWTDDIPLQTVYGFGAVPGPLITTAPGLITIRRYSNPPRIALSRSISCATRPPGSVVAGASQFSTAHPAPKEVWICHQV